MMGETQWPKLNGFFHLLALYSMIYSSFFIDHPETLFLKKTKPTQLIIPSGFHLVKEMTRNTRIIGTTDHPTIDGGQMGWIEAIPLNKIKTQKEKPKHYTPTKIAKPIIHENKAFEDNWATNGRVSHLLKLAAQDGKLKFVLKKAEQFKLPSTIAIIPMVESNYRNEALSYKGAAGAWQLMPSTAKDYGIKNNQRFQFEHSTLVALKLIRDLHRQFNNWTLVFAAYNAGSQRVRTALAKNPHSTSINELDLPLETKQYVKRIQAISTFLSKMNYHDY